MFRIAIVLCSLLFNGLINARSDFWRYDEYWQAHPSQKALSQSFSERVKNAPIPLSIHQEKPILIYLITPSRQLSDYWRRSRVALSKRLDELGIKYIIKSHDIKLNSDQALQLKLLERALANNPDFLIFASDKGLDMSSIQHILKQQKTHLILQNMTTPLKSLGSHQPLLYVGFDHETGTKMLAEYFMDSFSNTVKFAVVDFPLGYINELRGETFIRMLEQKNNFKMVAHTYTDGTQGSARSNTVEMIKEHPDLSFIYASATDIAIGTSKALQSLTRQDIKVNGWGGGSLELQALANGELDVTVMRMNDDNGIAMAEAIKLVLQEQQELVPVIYSGEFKLITSATPEMELNRIIKHAFRYSKRY